MQSCAMKKSVGEYYERLPYFRVCESYDGVLVTTPETAALVAIQKDSLFLEHLNASDALGIGHAILELANEWCPGRPMAVHIENDHHPLFVHFMDGTGVGNADWINKKKNVTRHFGQSSWRVRLEHIEWGVDFATETGLPPDDFRAEGGAVPLQVVGKGRVGTLVVSGLDGFEDHTLAVGGLQCWITQSKSA